MLSANPNERPTNSGYLQKPCGDTEDILTFEENLEAAEANQQLIEAHNEHQRLRRFYETLCEQQEELARSNARMREETRQLFQQFSNIEQHHNRLMSEKERLTREYDQLQERKTQLCHEVTLLVISSSPLLNNRGFLSTVLLN